MAQVASASIETALRAMPGAAKWEADVILLTMIRSRSAVVNGHRRQSVQVVTPLFLLYLNDYGAIVSSTPFRDTTVCIEKCVILDTAIFG